MHSYSMIWEESMSPRTGPHHIRNYKEGALEEFDRAIELNPGAAHVYFNRANLFQSMGRYDEAEKDYTRVLELTPSDRVAHLLRGETRAQQKKLPEAMADYFSYLSQTPDDQIHLKAASIVGKSPKCA